ncbi:helicase-related protein [Pseudonocardia kunmingensis]|uniref:SNF2 domain-containing protein n=1 Tax=Pseudonocardia kunmingensis TaxID=630975 RepID=A0A543DNZ4_9PSEU|nr:helicase-related protein [Pseudonocardia kunmingensis]TQM11051.1 SNF2 domain-containing protein [Pseudonocardia kunmingensis]
MLPEPGAQVAVDGKLVTVLAATPSPSGADLVFRRGDGTLGEASLDASDLHRALVPVNDSGGDPERALTGLWGRWMQYAVPRIRSAVLATRPLRPYAHQDEAVFTHMLAQPRLRFLLADEPGTGKTIMTGMYLAEGTRRGLIPGRTVIVVPAHLVEKWRRDLRRYFAIEADRLTPELARDPKELDPRVSVWVVSVDLYTYNTDVRRKVAGTRASWSLAVFDEAHRLTPTSQYLTAARELGAGTHHLLLLTATPHRGKEHFFRGLLNLLDPTLYPWDPRQTEYDTALRPSTLSFLRRMKEELKDFEGRPLFPPRYAETVPVDLTGAEEAAYTAVMDYVDNFYGENATLARSIYGKRAASSVVAAAATIRRREEALRGPASGRSDAAVPDEFVGDGTELQLEVTDEEAWQRAEDAVVSARTKDKGRELERIASVLEALRLATVGGTPTKWLRACELLEKHGIRPGESQLLVFSEFADTARWLAGMFANAGFTVETLEGAVGHRERDRLQQRFLDGDFQVLVSTDAGGEGIDLQSANVMIDWDIPWSLVRLEQRMGRLHRIGQTRPVHIYHLVAPATREGRVQEVMLENLEAAGESLGGRIFDLLDATAARAGFDYGRALVEAQRTGAPIHVPVPGTQELLDAARELVADEDRLHTPANTAEAMARFRADRLEAINPVIVDAFVDQLARARDWALGPGPAKGIREVTAQVRLPPALGGGLERLVAADGASVRQAINDGAQGLDDVVVLGPTEEPFAELVDLALHEGETELIRGTQLVDTAALTGYTLLIYDGEVEAHDGVRRHRRKAPLLIRFSAAGAFEIAWESLMTLRPDTTGSAATTLPPAVRTEGMAQAQAALAREVDRVRTERSAWVAKAREQLDQVEYRHLDELDELPAEVRRERREAFAALKADRLRQLEDIGKVTGTAPRLIGWAQVAAGARSTELGYDPDSEAVAVATVLEELERLGYVVDDRQTAGVGYDLFARHAQTGEQRLVEVKGFQAGLEAVWLEQHEWAQAQQRGEDYWLYVVTNCATAPTVVLRAQDPAGQLAAGPRRIERFQIKVTDLKQLMKGDQ